MAKRKVKSMVEGFKTVDGDGVHLVRVLGGETIEEYDPILMLDSFDSKDPKDYQGGFPMHPHRGIETISYIWKGKMVHLDSLGNEEAIGDGEVQWMNSGSGILHEERIPASDRLLGVQLWLNLPAKEKMSKPSYHGIHREEIPELAIDGGFLRVLAGSYKGHEGHKGQHLPLDYYDIHLKDGGELTLDTAEDDSVMIFTLLGEVSVEGEKVGNKTAAKLTPGSQARIKAENGEAMVLFIKTRALHEPVSWAGPIVMNSQAEIEEAFRDLRNGTFIREQADYKET